MKTDLWAEHAKEKARLQDDWRIFKWKCFPENSLETIYFEVTGAVCKTLKRNGEPDWRTRDRTTECVVNLPKAEHEAWKTAWSERTGICNVCCGERQVCIGWSVKDGPRYRLCGECNATGLFKQKSPLDDKP